MVILVNCPYCGAVLEDSGATPPTHRCTNGGCPLRSNVYYPLATLQARANNIRASVSWGKTFTGRFPSQQWLQERGNAKLRLFIERRLRTKKCPACKKKGVLIIRGDAGLTVIPGTNIPIPAEFLCENCAAHGDLIGLLPGKIWDKAVDLAKRYGVETLGEVVRGWRAKKTGEKGPKRIGGEVPLEGKKYWTERYFKAVARGTGRTTRYGYDKGREKWKGWREKRRAAKAARERGEEVEGGKVKIGAGKVLKAPFKAAKEGARFPFRMAGKRILKMRAPKPGKESRIGAALFPLILLIIGATVSAAVGNLFFMFAFLCFVGYSILPQPSDPVQKIIEKIENRYNKHLDNLQDKLNNAKTPEAQERIRWEIDRLERRMNRQIEFSVGSPWGVFKQTMTSGKIAIKEVFRWGAFALFSLAFLTSTFPFAKPIGLILAFVFYFMIGGER